MSRKSIEKSICTFPGCGRAHRSGGLCERHIQQKKEGKPLTHIPWTRRPYGSPPRVLYEEAPCAVRGLEGPCHVYIGRKDSDGYGKIYFDRDVGLVHRYVWDRDVGTIPDGMLIDHRCRNRACCNVKHLRVVTPKVNATENVVGSFWQLEAAKTHCPKGHAYTPENTIGEAGRNHRMCRKCGRQRCKEYYLRKKAQRQKDGK